MNRRRKRGVNLSRIAEQLGVSVSTVSRALRGIEGINPQTRARAMELAHDMGYSARVVKPDSDEVTKVLVLSQTQGLKTYYAYMAGISRAAVQSNIAIFSHVVLPDQSNMLLDKAWLPAALRDDLVDGIILLHYWPPAVAEHLCKQFPAVSIIYDYAPSPIDVIGIDEISGFGLLIGHLKEMGARRIGFFGLCPEVSWSTSRYGAFVTSMIRQGLTPEARWTVPISINQVLAPGEFRIQECAPLVRKITREVDAWVCSSASPGQSLCRFFMNEGISMPGQVAVACFHGDSAPASLDLPPMTTTIVREEDLGVAAVRRLMFQIKHKEERRSILLPTTLDIRQTSRTIPLLNPV